MKRWDGELHVFDEERKCNAVICDCRQRIESSLKQEGIGEDLEHEEEVSEVKEDFSTACKEINCQWVGCRTPSFSGVIHFVSRPFETKWQSVRVPDMCDLCDRNLSRKWATFCIF